jgi:type I restriction enzyme S subunit
VPEGWEVSSFSELAKLDTTSVKPNKKPEKVWEHFSIPAFDVDESPKFELGEAIKSNKYKVDKNSILSSKLNPNTPRTWWPDIEDENSAICSTEFMQFVPHKRDYRAFMLGMILSKPFQEGILKRVTGSTGSRQRAQPPQVANMEVILPSEQLMKTYSEAIKSLYVRKAKNIKENTSFAKVRDALLPKLLSGELSIATTEKAKHV